MKRHVLPLLLSLLFAPVVVTPAIAQTADEVVEKHLAAMGGRAALAKLTTRMATGMITVTLANGEISGPIELYSKAPNKTRAFATLDLSALGASEKLTLDQKFDGTAGWSLDSMQGNTQITGNQLENMRNATFPTPLLNYKETGTKVELLPNETVAGKSLIVLRLTPKTGSVARLYLDPASYLAVRTVATVNMPQAGGDVEVIAEALDYRTVDGIKVSFKTIQATSMQTVTIVLTTVQHNVAVDDAMFVVK